MNKTYFTAYYLYNKTKKYNTYIDIQIPTIEEYLNNKKYYNKLLLDYINHSLTFKPKIIKILQCSLYYKYLRYLFLYF
jgi:hypothetical protein